MYIKFGDEEKNHHIKISVKCTTYMVSHYKLQSSTFYIIMVIMYIVSVGNFCYSHGAIRNHETFLLKHTMTTDKQWTYCWNILGHMAHYSSSLHLQMAWLLDNNLLYVYVCITFNIIQQYWVIVVPVVCIQALTSWKFPLTGSYVTDH